MILNIRVNNFLVYSNEVELSLEANMHFKKLSANIHKANSFNVLKSVCIYGANNSGKTCLIRAINSIRNVLLSEVAEVPNNIFTDSKVCSFGIAFVDGEKAYSYDFKYDSNIVNGYKVGFVYECLKELLVDKYGNRSEKELYVRDVENNNYRFLNNDELSNVLSIVSNDNILIYSVNPSKYPIIEKYKTILRNFASKIDIVDMNNIPVDKTIAVLKSNAIILKKTVELIKLSDLDIDNFYYVKGNGNNIATNEEGDPFVRENALNNTVSVDDMLRLVSVHKGRHVQSLSFDSTGTKKIVALASYVVDALTNGRTLVIDELDSSLHFKLTRAIVALFNNDINLSAQLIFTAHDVTLLDCKKLFRKDQIWFASKDLDNEYLYSLADFTAQDNKVRSESDLFEKYNSGVLGAIPEPDLISVMIEESEVKEDN